MMNNFEEGDYLLPRNQLVKKSSFLIYPYTTTLLIFSFFDKKPSPLFLPAILPDVRLVLHIYTGFLPNKHDEALATEEKQCATYMIILHFHLVLLKPCK